MPQFQPYTDDQGNAIVGADFQDGGRLEYGATDQNTGKRFERFVHDQNVIDEAPSDVTTINTDDAISNLNKSKTKLDELSAIPPSEKKATDTNQAPSETKTSNLSFEDAFELFGDDFSGVNKNEDGTFTPSASAYERIGVTGMEESQGDKLENGLQELDNTMTTLFDDMKNYNVDNDPAFQAQSEAITAQYDKMRSDMDKINNSRKRGLETLGYRTGSTQYAGAVQLGIVGEEITQGNERILEITRQEQAAKSAARQAFENQNYAKFAQEMDGLDKIRDNKSEELTRYNNKLAEASKLLQEQADREFEITKWITDQGWKEKQFNLDTKQFEATYGLDVTKFGFDKEKFTQEFNFGIEKFQEDIRQFGETKSLEQLKLQIQQSDNAFDKQVKFETLLNTIPEGESISIGDLSGVGRKSKDLSISEQLSLAKEGMVIGADGKPVKLPNYAAIDAAKTKMETLNGLTELPGFNAAVGSNVFTRNAFDIDEPFNRNTANFVAAVKQFISQEALDALIAAKARGATFGALSDTEMDILKLAATKLSNMEAKSTKPLNWGEVVGYKMTEKQFKTEINTIKEKTRNLLMYSEMEKTDYTKDYGNFVNFASEYLPEYGDTIDNFVSDGYSDKEIYDFIRIDKGIQPIEDGRGGGGVELSDVRKIKDFSRVKSDFGNATATGIEAGSKFWSYGLDLALDGGKGAPIKSPVSGEVVQAKKDGNWGNSVKIKTSDGKIVRLSHLDSMNVKVGEKISSGTLIGGQGNTGRTYGKTGIHLDATVYKPNGKPYTSQEVAAMFNTQLS